MGPGAFWDACRTADRAPGDHAFHSAALLVGYGRLLHSKHQSDPADRAPALGVILRAVIGLHSALTVGDRDAFVHAAESRWTETGDTELDYDMLAIWLARLAELDANHRYAGHHLDEDELASVLFLILAGIRGIAAGKNLTLADIAMAGTSPTEEAAENA